MLMQLQRFIGTFTGQYCSKMKVHPAISMKTKADEHLSGTMEEVSEQSSARTTYCHELRAGERDPRFKMQKPRHRD
jgi:hypothetical protein